MSERVVLRVRDAITLRPLPSRIVAVSTVGATGPQGATGATGPAGPGVPVGGTTGQVLAKSSATDYATEWVDQPSGSIDLQGQQNLQWLPSRTIVLSGGASNRTVPTIGRQFCMEIVVTNQITVSSVVTGWTVAPTNGHQFLMGVYSADASWSSYTLLYNTSVTSDGTNGEKTVSGLSWSLPPGRYAVAYLVPAGETAPQGRWPQYTMISTEAGQTNAGTVIFAAASNVSSLVASFSPGKVASGFWPWGFKTWS